MAFPVKGSETAERDSRAGQMEKWALRALFLCLGVCVLVLLTLSLWDWVPNDQDHKLNNFLSAAGALIAFLGLVAAILTFSYSAKRNREQQAAQFAQSEAMQRRQHTITVLLETRLSSEVRRHIDDRRKVFPLYQTIDPIAFKCAMQGDNTHATLSSFTPTDLKAAQYGVSELLNYYEFLALGITTGDLDHNTLKESVRGLMCNLVDDAREVISEMREVNPKSYVHLIALYDNWRVPVAKDIFGKDNERPIPPAKGLYKPSPQSQSGT
ncbi:MAG: DUF4760 domain-containing protein [Pseudomonadota bacterium]